MSDRDLDSDQVELLVRNRSITAEIERVLREIIGQKARVQSLKDDAEEQLDKRIEALSFDSTL